MIHVSSCIPLSHSFRSWHRHKLIKQLCAYVCKLLYTTHYTYSQICIYVIYTQYNTWLLQYWVIHISGLIIETCPVSCGVICTCCRPVLQTVCYARLHMAAQHVFQMCRTVLKEFDLRAEAQACVNNIITNLCIPQMGYCDWGDLSHFFGTVVGLLGQSSSNNATVMLRHGESTSTTTRCFQRWCYGSSLLMATTCHDWWLILLDIM